MKSITNKMFTSLGKLLNINLIQFLNKTRFSQSLCNITNIQKRYKTKLAKPNLYVPKVNKDEPTGKMKFYGYFLLSVPIGTFILGTWQVQRRKWKLNLLEMLNERITHEPIKLPAILEELETKEYYPIKVKGTFIYEKEFIIGPRSLIVNGDAENNSSFGSTDVSKGYWVITPFKLSDRDLTILVNRGWIPRKLKSPATRQESQIKGEVEITGILRSNETRPPFVPKNTPNNNLWYYRDVNAMAEKVDAAPIYIELMYNKDFPKYPVGGQTKVKLRNDHLSYIITWYSLSGVTAYMWYKKIKYFSVVH